MTNNKDLTKALERLTAIVEKMTPPVAPIPPIPAIPAIPAIAPLVVTGDHDTIIQLVKSVDNLDSKFTEKFSDLKSDIKSLGDGTTTKINDHEGRIRDNEKQITKIMTWGTAALVIISIAQFLVGKFL